MAALNWLIWGASVVVMFLLLIAPHEGGHFALAKLFKVRVIEFSLGMGSKLWSGTAGGTVYALRALPIGGFVRLGGMEPGDYSDPAGFHFKPAWQRILILLGGPAVNFLVAIVIATAIAAPAIFIQPGTVTGLIVPSPAYSAGIRPGDRILSIDGHTVRQPTDIRKEVDANPTGALVLVVAKSGGGQSTVTVTPEFVKSQNRPLIGIETQPPATVGQVLLYGVTYPWETTKGIFSGIVMLATGQIPGGILGGQGLTGAIGIGYMTINAAQQGPLVWLTVVAILSVALGFANLLPLPALDGGRIMVVLLEALRGRPFDREKEMQVQRYGLVALLALVAFIAYFDIQRILNHQFPGLK